MKTELTPADKEKVFRSIAEPTWVHYFWKDNAWFVAPCDPRQNIMLTNIHRASQQKIDGYITRGTGIEEVK